METIIFAFEITYSLNDEIGRQLFKAINGNHAIMMFMDKNPNCLIIDVKENIKKGRFFVGQETLHLYTYTPEVPSVSPHNEYTFTQILEKLKEARENARYDLRQGYCDELEHLQLKSDLQFLIAAIGNLEAIPLNPDNQFFKGCISIK